MATDPQTSPTPPTTASDDRDAVIRLAMQGARMGTWLLDIESDRVEWSAELEEIFGLTPGAFAGNQAAFRSLVHPDDESRLNRAVQQAIENGTDYIVEFRFRHASGEWRWMDGRGKATYDANGKPIRLYGVGMDITERKRVEITQARLAAIVESSDDAIISKTLESIVTSWNSGAERLFGYSAQEMLGQSITRVIPYELLSEEDLILSKLRRGERIEHYETVRTTKDGRRIDVSLSVSPLYDPRGNIIGASKIARNITERKRIEEALRDNEARLRKIVLERQQLLDSERAARSEAERLSHVKDEFLATLSHELRTPLNAIQGWVTLLRRHGLRQEDHARGLETIERNVRAQTQIVNDLLDMNRIVSGKLHLDVQLIDLNDVIEAAVEVVRPSADAKRIRIRKNLAASAGLARGDSNRLQQVMWNLLANAVKFTPPEGTIRVVLQRAADGVEILVEDSGMGIKAEFLPYVFDRFRQADPSTTRRHGGLGLGLSIVKNLVELHGGSVRAESAGENQGASFIVALPVSVLQPQDTGLFSAISITSDAAIDAPLTRLDDICILVVDDEADSRDLVQRILESCGAKIISVTNAVAALENLNREPVDVLLSDIGMPRMDGYELIGRVRKLDASNVRRIPAIALTAYARPEDRQRSLLAGYQMHISKPIDARELTAGIASLLKLSR
jgi:PAS domain S-box-containing protein